MDFGFGFGMGMTSDVVWDGQPDWHPGEANFDLGVEAGEGEGFAGGSAVFFDDCSQFRSAVESGPPDELRRR